MPIWNPRNISHPSKAEDVSAVTLTGRIELVKRSYGAARTQRWARLFWF